MFRAVWRLNGGGRKFLRALPAQQVTIFRLLSQPAPASNQTHFLLSPRSVASTTTNFARSSAMRIFSTHGSPTGRSSGSEDTKTSIVGCTSRIDSFKWWASSLSIAAWLINNKGTVDPEEISIVVAPSDTFYSPNCTEGIPMPPDHAKRKPLDHRLIGEDRAASKITNKRFRY